jgi:hypothetical protein
MTAGPVGDRVGLRITLSNGALSLTGYSVTVPSSKVKPSLGMLADEPTVMLPRAAGHGQVSRRYL